MVKTVDSKDVKEENLSLTLMKGLQILEAFTSVNLNWGIRDLARELKINPSTVFRLVTTLTSLGYLEKDTVSRRYSLGPAIMKQARVYMQHNPLRKVALKVFEKYQSRFEHSFYLISLTKKYDAIYLAASEGTARLKVAPRPGGQTALHSTAAGKILLAFSGDDYAENFLKSSDLTRFTPRTITDPEKLKKELCQVREQGYAVNDGEQYEDIGAVAVPVYDQNGRLTSSVSLAYPRHLVADGRLNLEDSISIATEVANEIMAYTFGLTSAKATSANPHSTNR